MKRKTSTKRNISMIILMLAIMVASYAWSGVAVGERFNEFSPEIVQYGEFAFIRNNAMIFACGGALYHNLEDVNRSATLIISGEVIDDSEQMGVHIPSTNMQIRIDEVYKGDKQPGDIITVNEIGSHLPDGRDESVDTVPLMRKGDRVFLMLYEMEWLPDRELWGVVASYGGKFFYKDAYTLIYSGSLAFERDGVLKGDVQLEEFAYSDFQRAMDTIERKSGAENARALNSAVRRVRRNDGGEEISLRERQRRQNNARAYLEAEIEQISGLLNEARVDEELQESIETVIALVDAPHAASISKDVLVQALEEMND